LEEQNLPFTIKQDEEDQHYVAYFYDGKNEEKIKNLGFPVFKIKGIFFRYDPFAYFRLKKLVKKIKPDLIHSALWAANLLSRIVAQSLRIPIICDLHSNFWHDGKLRIFLEKYFLFDVQRYVAVSTTAKEGFTGAVVEKLKNEKKKRKIKFKICTILNGIDVQDVRKKGYEQKISRQDIGLNENDFVVGAVGRLEPIKSYDLLIKSFSGFVYKLQDPFDCGLQPSLRVNGKGGNKLQDRNIGCKRNPKLCIVGDGSLRMDLEKLVEELDIFDHVIFLGQKDDAYGLYPLFDCFVLSSTSEGLSVALLEALCFGLPIISTTANTKHDVIVDRINGFLIPPGSVFELAEAMGKLYTNHELRKKIGRANLELVRSKFGIDGVKKTYHTLYKQVVGEKELLI